MTDREKTKMADDIASAMRKSDDGTLTVSFDFLAHVDPPTLARMLLAVDRCLRAVGDEVNKRRGSVGVVITGIAMIDKRVQFNLVPCCAKKLRAERAKAKKASKGANP